MKKILIILGVLIILLVVISLFFSNYNFGVIVIAGGISGALILYGLFFDRLIRMKWLTYSILAGCVVVGGLVLFIGVYGQTDNVTFDEDAAIVLGAGIRGEQVSLMLSYRLDKAAEYSALNPEAVIVVSGGQGHQEDIPEAVAMERYLVAKGVPKERIIKEDRATSTYENVRFSKELLDGLFTDYKAVVISNNFHIYRAVRLAEKAGLTVTHLHAKTNWYSIPANYLRECAAVIRMWVISK